MASFRVNGDLLGINVEGGGMEIVEVTRAEYEALKPGCLTDGKLYKITDEDDEPLYASDIKYKDDSVGSFLDKFIFVTKSFTFNNSKVSATNYSISELTNGKATHRTNILAITCISVTAGYPLVPMIGTNNYVNIAAGLGENISGTYSINIMIVLK